MSQLLYEAFYILGISGDMTFVFAVDSYGYTVTVY